jgi:xylulokinase
VARSVLEGCAFAARDVIDRLAALGFATDELLLCGGGATSALWAQIHADIAGRTATIAAYPEYACGIGAAVLAAVAAGLYPDLDSATGELAPPRAHVEPRVEARASCDDAYTRYRALFDALKPLFGSRADAVVQ